ncbi:fructose-bisphosphate aldolase [Micromonospora rhizosphaerae]|uniref:Fructose-bisphosphate aldolase n=1 Tax=Micromonospora rhizosphaerae TaxID=568872 RepID=A0A1C6SBH1_9ACTN|nr:class II fructose-bisphosphate aldolase [Micromonospora rhizosphaerae]SCL26830.1 fructose-bisphosphate aldolase [Micromonospora rhizosphaerae]
MRVSTGEIVAAAAAAGRGAGAFNVITLEHAEAIVAGAERVDRPVILQLSENAVGFHLGRVRPIAAALGEIATAARVPVSLHLDHVADESLLHQTADAGFSSVMFDASTRPYQENVAVTRAAADWAHERGLWLEAELGEVGGKDGAHAPGVRTDPRQAESYVAATGVDALAVAVGSSHAMTTREAALDLDLIAQLRKTVPVPLVLHGSSGVPDEHLRGAIGHGMVKINFGTALNLAYTGAVRDVLAGPNPPVDPRKYLRVARDAVADVVAHLLTVLDKAAG